MAILNFTLSPDAVDKLNNAIACLGKFSESVTIEATKDCFALTTLNSTNSAYAAFSFAGNKFFSTYAYNPPRTNGVLKEKFCCKMYNKALHSVFRGRNIDPAREKDTSIERCDVSIEDGAGEVKSRFVVKMAAKHGVIKTYKLTFEAHKAAHAYFDKESSRNTWSITSKILREFIEHFGPGTEQLDIYSDDGRVNFITFTEKIMSGNEVLKQPLHTSIAIDTLEFSDFRVEQGMHIVINVKDFKAIIMHAGLHNIKVSVAYSTPTRPMQIKYTSEGMTSEFVLMTIGDQRGGSATPAPAARKSAPRQLDRRTQDPASMPPPGRSAAPSAAREMARLRNTRPSPPPPQATLQDESLFVTQDDDHQWDPTNYDEDEEEEMLGWDASADDDTAVTGYTPSLQNNRVSGQTINGRFGPSTYEIPKHVEPTQRMSQIKGLFDD